MWQKCQELLPTYQVKELAQLRSVIQASDCIEQQPPVDQDSCKRKLSVNISDVSVDVATGLPTLSEWKVEVKGTSSQSTAPMKLPVMDMSDEEKSLLKSSMDEDYEVLPAKKTGPAGLYAKIDNTLRMKKPAAAKPSPAIVKDIVMKKPSSGKPSHATVKNVVIDKTSMQLKGPYPKTKKSEILHWPGPDKKQQLVVSLSEKRHIKFHDTLKKVITYIKNTKGCTKHDAQKHLQELLK